MNHDMSRYALENGPDEPRYRYCPHCGGSGTRQGEYRLYDCPICKGEGEIPVDDVDEDES